MDRNAVVQKMASQFGLDANALHHLVAFLRASHARHRESGKIPDAMSAAEQEAYIRAGVVAWRDHTSALLEELRDGLSDRAKAFRAELVVGVYDSIRSNIRNPQG
ncbi:hypothetical protein [Achromobacter xylosoxidans]|uniref:hypothetical protein n=1 Tax=Alcaligenes xylosoxydans xylosoxydans TaxID=85698 RepID=UPI002449714F|nr:hypothetical protein [Achromobacter xylosoxidans]MDH0521715.1 hypothetical protein [Achromobacter xylosoxidans]MDH0545902.1 hypothetical protein [Achromobacter xylosoxidans]